MKDKLEKIFHRQKSLNEKLYGEDVNVILDQRFINLNIMALYDEVGEVMRETAWKNPEYTPFGWKTQSELNIEGFKEELVDTLHFFINLCISAGMGPDELFERYERKNDKNHKRKEDGY